MRPLTKTTPKPLIEVCGKPILEYVVEALPDEIDELILVVGYLQEQIRSYCGDVFCGKQVTYVAQENFSGGTGDALLCVKEMVYGRFMLLNADDIHGTSALQQAVEAEHAVIAATTDTPQLFGVLMQRDDGTLDSIVEKPQEPLGNLINTGGYVLDTHIFEYSVAVNEEHGELFVTDMFTQYAQDYPVQIVEQDMWIPVGKPEDIETAESILCPEK